MNEKLLSIGKIVNFHGINGEVKVGYTNNREKQLETIKEFYVWVDKTLTKLTKTNLRFHKDHALMKFKEINSIDEVIKFKGAFLMVEKNKIENSLEEDEFFIEDLKDMSAYDTKGNYIGKIEQILRQGPTDLLSIKDDNGKEHLVPFVKKLVPEVNLKEKNVVINAIPGLIEQD